MKTKRQQIVMKTSIITIVTNIFLSIFKAIIGFLSNSIAIISDAINNLSDVLSSIITIIGTKLASKAPDKNHPYGHGRIEYMTSLVVSVIVLYAGLTAMIESVKKIINPEEVNYNIYSIIILIAAIIAKFILGMYVKKKGCEANSDALVASGSDALSDAIVSTSVLLSAIIYILFKISLEAYVGILVSLIIIKTGYELIRKSIDNILDTRTESSLSRKIKKEIEKEENVEGAFDLILNDYGPDKYLGSVHIEVLDTLTVREIDKISRKITKKIIEKYGVLLHTIGIYSINTKDEEIIKIKNDIKDIVFSHDGILEFHGFYLDKEDMTISFDIIIDFKIKNREELYSHIYDEIQKKYKDYKLYITLDVDVSD